MVLAIPMLTFLLHQMIQIIIWGALGSANQILAPLSGTSHSSLFYNFSLMLMYEYQEQGL